MMRVRAGRNRAASPPRRPSRAILWVSALTSLRGFSYGKEAPMFFLQYIIAFTGIVASITVYPWFGPF